MTTLRSTLAALLLAFIAAAPAMSTSQPSALLVSADVDAVKGPHDRSFNLCVGSGRARLGLHAAWQRDMAVAHRECGFTFVRMHGILHDDMGVYREEKDGTPRYNFLYVDEVYDFLLSIGMKPYVELSFMPAALASGEKTVFWAKCNVTPPKDFAKWEALIRKFTEHLTERYGRDEVKTWYFEVWNEPNHPAFFSGKRDDYFKIYQSTARVIKEVCADYRVGGPATAGRQWVDEMIGFCSANHVPLDFISTHNYGNGGWGVDPREKVDTSQPDQMKKAAPAIRDMVCASTMPSLPVHFTEWSKSSSDKDPFHDSYLSAAYITDTTRRVEGAQEIMSYWTFSDVFEENGVPKAPFYGGFGLMNIHGLRKSAFFAYKWMNELGETDLQCDCPTAWVCKRPGGRITAMFWDYTPVKAPAGDAPPTGREREATLRLRNVPTGNYELSVYRVGYGRNDVYTEYLHAGAPPTLTRKDVEKLQQVSTGAAEVTENVSISDGGLERSWKLRENDVCFVSLTPRDVSRH